MQSIAKILNKVRCKAIRLAKEFPGRNRIFRSALLSNEILLATHNVKEFKRVEILKFGDWGRSREELMLIWQSQPVY